MEDRQGYRDDRVRDYQETPGQSASRLGLGTVWRICSQESLFSAGRGEPRTSLFRPVSAPEALRPKQPRGVFFEQLRIQILIFLKSM